MPRGPGRYDEVCTVARMATNASALLLIVIGGRRGDGFEVQCEPGAELTIPAMLRKLADAIEADTKQTQRLRREGLG